jgi:hypothetical protein
VKSLSSRFIVPGPSWLVVGLATLLPLLGFAQWQMLPPTTPDTQRNALNAVRSQVNWLQNATRTASSYGANGVGSVWQHFQALRGSYAAFKQTLNPNQLAAGANSLAELDAGLDIIQEAFANYQDDVAAGQLAGSALRNMCQVLREGSSLWLQELNKTCSRLRVGWG